MLGHSLFPEKIPIQCTLYFQTPSLQGIFAVRKCSDTKNMSLISHNLYFSLPEYFVCLLCLPMLPVSVLDKPLCLIRVH